jgi:acetyl-CoA carboxylase carboxyl transferase subunit alpha
MSTNHLDFELPIIELEKKIEELRRFTSKSKMDLCREIEALEKKAERLKKEIFANLAPRQRIQLARHSQRPHTLDYINLIMDGFHELHGDRMFSDDKAIIGGLCKFNGETVLVIGHQKGSNIQENIERNFGMPHPEGYRKALRLMRLAEKFNFPVITLIDTPGAYPGIGAEERGQAEAIARNLMEMSTLKTPLISLVIGEGGSGGALGIGVADRTLMLENAIYSVISPEGCAAILWQDRRRAGEAADALCLTAQDIMELRIIDEIVPEPLDGAHKNHKQTATLVAEHLEKNLVELKSFSIEKLIRTRFEKHRHIGKFLEGSSSGSPLLPQTILHAAEELSQSKDSHPNKVTGNGG